MKHKTTASARVKSERHESDTNRAYLIKNRVRLHRESLHHKAVAEVAQNHHSPLQKWVLQVVLHHARWIERLFLVHRSVIAIPLPVGMIASARPWHRIGGGRLLPVPLLATRDRRLLSKVAKNLRVVVTVVLPRVSVRNRFVLGEWRRSVPMK